MIDFGPPAFGNLNHAEVVDAGVLRRDHTRWKEVLNGYRGEDNYDQDRDDDLRGSAHGW